MNSGDCPICFDCIANENGLVEPCFHVFCLTCIHRWTETSFTCPVCRVRIIRINGSQIGEARCELCHEPLESFGRLVCFHCGRRLDRCDKCTEPLLTNDEDAWSCPRCGHLTQCPTPSTVSSFTIEESPYTLHHFDDQGVTNSRDNLSFPVSSNSTITNHQDSNVVEYIMENMNRTHNTPGLTTSPGDKKGLNPGRLEKIKKMVKAALIPYYKNKSISKQEYRRLLDKIVCKIIESKKRLSRTAVERLAEEYILYQRERPRRGL